MCWVLKDGVKFPRWRLQHSVGGGRESGTVEGDDPRKQPVKLIEVFNGVSWSGLSFQMIILAAKWRIEMA